MFCRFIVDKIVSRQLTLRQAEQQERRRLEEELRNLKKAQGPGKSMLSQSAVSTPTER